MRYAGIMIFVLALFAGQSVCFGQAVSSSDMIAYPKDFDNKTVTYSGEVIGDVMRRGDHAWINVNDGRSAVGVWITAAMASEIGPAGDFKHTGDIVEVTGVFNRVCVQHGGDLDIHAQSMQVLRRGSLKECVIDKVKKDWAVKLLGVVAILWILSLLKMR